MSDLNRYSPAFFEPTIVSEKSSFGEAAGATLGLRFAPAIDSAAAGIKYAGQERDPNFKWEDNLGDYGLYATSLYGAKNAQHMAQLKANIDRSIQRREVLSNSTMMTQLGAGLVDPINIVALPLGGPTLGVVKSAVRVGVGTAAVEGTAEAINLQLDPVKTLEEATINTASAALFGGALGGAISIPMSRRAAAFEKVNQSNAEMFDMANRIENLEGLTPSDIRSAPVRAERPLGSLEDAEIRETIRTYEADAQRIEADGASEKAIEIRNEARSYRNELGLRQLEADNIDLDNPYDLKSNWFINSPLYKAVSTPMKRTLQGKYPNAVKEAFLRAFGDNGMTLAMNSIGLPTPQSVAVRSAVSAGRWVKAQDEMVKLWAADTDASVASRLDINFSDVARRGMRSDQTYRQWLTNVSEKRLRGVTDMTENELKASSVINKYFEDAEVRLQEVGLLGDAKGMARQIEMLELEIAGLKSSLTGVRKTSMEYEMVDARIKKLKGRRSGLDGMRSEPDAAFDRDVFFPRFFDKGAIRNRREEFSNVLYSWFEKNPYVYRMDGDTPVKIDLSTNPEKIMERVNQTIDGILGEADPLNLDTVSFGMGRSKHFRSRQLDIPNKLVTDFMMKDPLAVMKTYAARIEPRYEFAKQFGKDLDGVRFDIERAMIKDGKSRAEINKVMRDFNHMYDRTIGTVLEYPDALSQKVAFVLREAASFSYMGSSGLAAIPDFGRIVMEYDLDNVWKGVQALLDKERINMTVDEVRLAGEAIDILKGSAHMRLMEDMSNNIDANDLLSQTRNAFYILNGLAPLTTIAKQLAGVIDAHTIIDYSIKLGKGQLDDQSIEWLARHGIGKEMAEKIARAPYEKTENGFYMANTEQWADSIYIPEIEGKQVRLIEMNEDGTPVGKSRNGRYIPAFYKDKEKTIRFDRDYIEGPMFESKSWLNPKMEGVNALPDIFKTPKQWANFVMLHEINHSRFRPEDLGLVETKNETIKVSEAPVGMSRNEIIQQINSNESNSNLAFHVTNNPTLIMEKGFRSGGMTIGKPIDDMGYGDYIAVFDYSKVHSKLLKDSNFSKVYGSDPLNQDLLSSIYSGAEAVSLREAEFVGDRTTINAFNGEKPVAVIRINEVESFAKQRVIGPRAEEVSDIDAGTIAENKIQDDYLNGLVDEEYLSNLSILDLPPSFMSFESDKEILDYLKESLSKTEKTISKIQSFKPLEKTVKRSSKVVNTAKYENKINELALKDYREAQTLNEEMVTQFRAALNSGVLNTIMSGTPADKPIITDGIVYIPMSVASKFGMKEHPKFKGYARIENGLMGLPFQFYSFVLANVNKTVGALAQGQIKNRAIGSATMMGLAYMSLQLRTPEYIWNDMSAQDRFARSFDMSGIMALYSDVFYTSMHTSLALGGPNITGGLLSPKFNQQASVADAITGLAGAGPSWGYDTAKGVVNFASGNYGEGGKDIVRNLPFARMWFLKDDVNQITNAWAN